MIEGVLVKVRVGVRVTESEREDVTEIVGDTLALTLIVGVIDMVGDTELDFDIVGVTEDVLELVGVVLDVFVFVAVVVGDFVTLLDSDAVFEVVREGVTVLEVLRVIEGVTD